jgi:hypothetical protein
MAIELPPREAPGVGLSWIETEAKASSDEPS